MAAGNEFVFGFTVGSPASADAALAVGALDQSQLPSEFSQRGRMGDVALKPELVAPGVDITAARSKYMTVGEGELVGYLTASGTSMAAPHVAGAAALLSQRHPDWTGDKLKAVLMGSAQLLDGQTALAQGAGLVNIPAALDLQLRAEPAAVSFGRQVWPHQDDSVVERALTLHNDSDSEVTVDLKIEAQDADGASVAPDMFTLSASQARIAAHEHVEVKLSADTRRGSKDGLYSGELVATHGDEHTRLHVPFIIDREVESYDLVLQFTGRDGQPAPADQLSATVIGEDSVPGNAEVFVEPDGTAKLRLPRGKYVVSSHQAVPTADAESFDLIVLIQPELILAGDTSLELDARAAKPVRISPS